MGGKRFICVAISIYPGIIIYAGTIPAALARAFYNLKGEAMETGTEIIARTQSQVLAWSNMGWRVVRHGYDALGAYTAMALPLSLAA